MKRKKIYLIIFVLSFIILYFPEYSIGYKENVSFEQARNIVKESGGIITTPKDGGRIVYARMNLIGYFLLKMHSKKFDFIDFEFRGREARTLDVSSHVMTNT